VADRCAGRWLEPAREYVGAHAATLRGRPVWLFSGGPIGAPRLDGQAGDRPSTAST
jgi:hypothetical protein